VSKSSTYTAPWITAVTPMAVRSKSRPTPGHPPGNVENSLCSLFLLAAGRQSGRAHLKL
jgi:hypothetical protein